MTGCGGLKGHDDEEQADRQSMMINYHVIDDRSNHAETQSMITHYYLDDYLVTTCDDEEQDEEQAFDDGDPDVFIGRARKGLPQVRGCERDCHR